MVTTQQFADIYPHTVFFPNDQGNGYLGSYSKEYGYQGQTLTPFFNDNAYITKEAWQVFNTIGQKHDKVRDYFRGSYMWS